MIQNNQIPEGVWIAYDDNSKGIIRKASNRQELLDLWVETDLYGEIIFRDCYWYNSITAINDAPNWVQQISHNGLRTILGIDSGIIAVYRPPTQRPKIITLEEAMKEEINTNRRKNTAQL